MAPGLICVNWSRYCHLMTQPDWSGRLAAVVASQVRRYRQARGWSTQRLADECTKLGLSIQRSVLANFESGRRTTVTIAEVLVFGKALGVPPILLFLPVGTSASVEILPGQERSTWAATKWFTGEAAFPVEGSRATSYALVGTDTDNAEWTKSSEPIRLHIDHDQVLLTVEWESERLAKAREAGDEDVLGEATDRLDRFQKHLAHVRREMRKAGIEPPALPDHLADIDDRWTFVRALSQEQARALAEGRFALDDLDSQRRGGAGGSQT